jgi:hypothetical protein
MLVIERLLGTTIEPERGEAETDLDQAHVDKIVHVLRRDCGEHGARLADVLVQQEGEFSDTRRERRQQQEGDAQQS